ncbi:hypothetical protein BsWGS_09828 [Bradybaena similaris]
MQSAQRRFIPTPLGLQERERYGMSVPRLKESLFGRRLALSQSLYKRDLRGHFGCVNAIEFSSDGDLIASGGDDRRLLLWNLAQTIFDDQAPHAIDTLHISNINTCCFHADNRAVATGGNDGQVIVHDINVRQSTAVYGLSDAVYCLSPDPINATIIATATDDGKAQIIDLRMSIDTAPFVLADLSASMHSIMFNPAEPRLLATANSKHGIGLWDVRMPLKCLQYKSNVQNCMSVRFNSRGDQLLALRRRSCPVLYDIAKLQPVYEFDYKTYYNACTLKSCSFAGLKDEYVMSGSDDFCIYLWKIPTGISENYIQSQPHMILKGHRSIVNQVRYCPYNQTIVSSGVEKLVKMWSPYYIPGCTGRLAHSHRYGDDEEIERNAYSHEEYIHMVLQAGSFLSHDYSNGSMDEEPCMIAFFDSLIQREIEQSVEGADEDQESDGGVSSHDGDSDGGPRQAGGPGQVTSLDNDDQEVIETPGRVKSLRYNVSSHNSSTANEREDASNTRDTSNSSSSQLEDSSRPYFMDLDSSSDSEAEVDVILSAMYSRYMSARERALNCNLRPSGKKISSVIAKGKQRDRSLQKQMRSRKRQRIRKNVTSMSILADVIDTFVDNLVAAEPNNNHTLSDTNDGHLSTDSGGSHTRDDRSTPAELMQQTLTLHTDDTAGATASITLPVLPRPAVTRNRAGDVPVLPVTLESGMYFMPELQAFAPESFNAVANLAHAPGTSRSNNLSSNTPLDASRTRRRSLPSKSPSEFVRKQTLTNSSAAHHTSISDNINSSSGGGSSRCSSGSSRCSSGGSSNEKTSVCVSSCSSSSSSARTTGRPTRSQCISQAASELDDQGRQEFNKHHIPVPSTIKDCLPVMRETARHNHQSAPSHSSSSSSTSTATGCHNAATAETSTDAGSSQSVSVHFKKAKVIGKKFRVHKFELSSSSDDDK